MKSFPACVLAASVAFLAACSTFESRELAAFRARGVSPQIIAKLDRDDPLTPPEIIALSRRVPDSVIIRHLDAAGVDYLVTREDVRQLQRSGVSARVIDVLLIETDRFARRYYYQPVYPATSYWWGSSLHFGPAYYYPAWY